ncbi:putative bifunctional diguanylate cyclase/phosphodiesterase [Devosia sp. LjRoot3]|uniref:putative bifunctional diguanylate cyclase/phosphodiesterase n=1 Tax=Devosia sp. LjRoot3 TaxID=3342319 RepID=UPI003ECC92D0
MNFFVYRRPLTDAVLLLLFGAVIFALGAYFDIVDSLLDWLAAHEHWEADEVLLGVVIVGLLGFIYAGRRLTELRLEVQRRAVAEDKTTWVATHDTLTGLPNRRYLEKEGSRFASDYRASIVLAIDLDDFKDANDLVGHAGGDKLLSIVAARLQERFRGSLVVRMGGDEFLILFAGSGDPVEIGTQVVQLLSNPISVDGVQVGIGASIGVAELREHDIADAMHCADLAMYAAKRRGKNNVVKYSQSLRMEFQSRVGMESALRRAVREDEIRPHFQPLIDIHANTIVGFEALARWTGKDGFPIPPDVFIGIAEEAGLITQLSERLLRTACQQAMCWPEHVYLSFNISATQLSDHLLPLRIIQILGEIGMPAHRLEIEVTEAAIVRDMTTALRSIEAIRAAGIRVAIDDFGTGFSSLSQLANIPFDRIKVDRSFVSSFEANDRQMKVMRLIVGLGHGLEVEMTAEGIETGHQRDLLAALGCQVGQGYLFGKALPGDQVATFIRDFGEASLNEEGMTSEIQSLTAS